MQRLNSLMIILCTAHFLLISLPLSAQSRWTETEQTLANRAALLDLATAWVQIDAAIDHSARTQLPVALRRRHEHELTKLKQWRAHLDLWLASTLTSANCGRLAVMMPIFLRHLSRAAETVFPERSMRDNHNFANLQTRRFIVMAALKNIEQAQAALLKLPVDFSSEHQELLVRYTQELKQANASLLRYQHYLNQVDRRRDYQHNPFLPEVRALYVGVYQSINYFHFPGFTNLDEYRGASAAIELKEILWQLEYLPTHLKYLEELLAQLVGNRKQKPNTDPDTVANEAFMIATAQIHRPMVRLPNYTTELSAALAGLEFLILPVDLKGSMQKLQNSVRLPLVPLVDISQITVGGVRR